MPTRHIFDLGLDQRRVNGQGSSMSTLEVKVNIHFPMDLLLLWDVVLCLIHTDTKALKVFRILG